MKKIKVLKETPFNKQGAIISIKEFKDKYNYVFSSEENDILDDEIITYLNKERECVLKSPETTASYPLIGTFFEVIDVEEPFKVGEWVWHEKLKEAFQIIKYEGQCLWPNHATLGAVTQYTDTWKRRATEQEYINSVLHYFYIDSHPVLVGKNKVYVKVNTWKEVIHAKQIIFNYVNKEHKLGLVRIGDRVFEAYDSGITIGCVTIPSDVIKRIREIMQV